MLSDLRTKPASHWEREGRSMATRLFRFVAKTVPAYRAHLRTKGINPHTIRSIHDFNSLPLIDKSSYLKAYEYADLFPNRDITIFTTISATSGSTGEPFYFPRGEMQDSQHRFIHELILKNQFDITKKDTLAVIGFGMGIWIGGILTYKVCNDIDTKGHALALAPIGANIGLCLTTIKKLGYLFNQIILIGYPPFIKDIIDEGKSNGINWHDHEIKILTAAEGYTEQFRDYIARKTAMKNPLSDMVNIYGSVELGAMAHDTPLANLIRSIASQHTSVAKALFGTDARMPTFAQYHPGLIYFEQEGTEVIASGFGSAIPLIRYRFPDRGGVLSYDEVMLRLKNLGVDILKEAKKEGIDKMIWRLPFVFIFERADNTLILRGANIHAEHVKSALQDRKLEHAVTGKFTMRKKEDARLNMHFEIYVEMKKDVSANRLLAKRIQSIMVSTLRAINTEYNDQYNSVPRIMTPKIILKPYHDRECFAPGAKQKWTRN